MIVKTTSNSRGMRLGNFVQIRDVIDEELESVWAGKKTAKQALDDAVKRGNELIVRFAEDGQGIATPDSDRHPSPRPLGLACGLGA